MEELLSLKWNNHRSTFLHILAVLRDKQLYTDATLACDGKLYSVHKLVLSTCSDYFSSMLDRTSCKSPVIVLKDIKCEDLEALLDYMYLGEVNVRQSDLATLIKAAECLRVKGLAVPDDEPPPRKTRPTENQSRRGDTSGSPPAKRKRRSDVEDGREDVRPVKVDNRHSSPVHSSSRPKSPLSNNSNHSTPSRTNSTTNAQVTSNSTSNNTASTTAVTASRQSTDSNAAAGEDYIESAPFVKVEMEEEDTGGGGADGNTGDGAAGGGGGDSSNAADMGDSYNLSNDDFKEEDDNDGGDLGSDLPEFLQQAAGNYPHSSFAGPSFQPDVSWQGGDGSGGLAGSFAAAAAGLSFGGQQDGGHNASAGGGTPVSDAGREHYCPTCGKLFNGRNWKQNLEYHMFKHTGLKPFRCPFCRHSSALKFNLLRHIKNKHSDLIALGMLPDQHMLHKQLQQQQDLMAMAIQPSDDLLLPHPPVSINRNCQQQQPQQQHHELDNLSAQLKESLFGAAGYLGAGGAASSAVPPLQGLQSPPLPQTSSFQQMFGSGSQALLPSESFSAAAAKPLFSDSAAHGDGGSHDNRTVDAAANYSGGCDTTKSSTDKIA